MPTRPGQVGIGLACLAKGLSLTKKPVLDLRAGIGACGDACGTL